MPVVTRDPAVSEFIDIQSRLIEQQLRQNTDEEYRFMLVVFPVADPSRVSLGCNLRGDLAVELHTALLENVPGFRRAN